MTYVANRHQRLIEIKFSWAYGDCCIHPPSIVSHSFSSACKWQLLRTALQPTHSLPLCLTFTPFPLFPIFLLRFAFSYLPFHNNEISDQWRWITSVLFTPLDDDGKGSVCLIWSTFSRHALRRHFILSTACPGRLCRKEIGPIRGCARSLTDAKKHTGTLPWFTHSRAAPQHMVTVACSQEGWYQRCNLCFFFSLPLSLSSNFSGFPQRSL